MTCPKPFKWLINSFLSHGEASWLQPEQGSEALGKVDINPVKG